MKDKTMHRVRLLRGFVLIEMLMVVGLIGLMTAVAVISFSAMWGNLKFKSQAEELVNVFQMAQDAATTTDRRYAVILDFSEQAFVLREFKSLDLQTMADEDAIIQTKYFSDALTLAYVQYDDLEDTREEENVTEVRFLAGKSGWQFGGIIVLLDADGDAWTIVIHRFGKPAELIKGQLDLDSLGMRPKYKENVPF